MSEKLVVCRSKTSLTCGHLQIVARHPQGTQKAPTLFSFFDVHLLDFEDSGDKQCIEINTVFSEELMLFQQFCLSIIGEHEQVQAHLCIRATTFCALPVLLPRQV